VLKISTEKRPIDVLVVRGVVENNEGDGGDESLIVVRDLGTGTAIGTFSSTSSGDYSLPLPNGGKVLLTVTTPGMKTQSDTVQLPFTETLRPFSQTISYENGKLKIVNSFDAPASEDSYVQYLAVIEEKARLDVNEGKPA